MKMDNKKTELLDEQLEQAAGGSGVGAPPCPICPKCGAFLAPEGSDVGDIKKGIIHLKCKNASCDYRTSYTV